MNQTIQFRSYQDESGCRGTILQKITPFELRVATLVPSERVCTVKWSGSAQEWVETKATFGSL